MIQNYLARILFMPFSILYGLGVEIRNFLYKKKLLKGVAFDIPIISVGNLAVGGAGKTPHIEYLIELLKPYIDIATVSRGYKRKTKGYLEVQPGHNAEQVGDEPLQYKRKYRDILVSVAENRTFAIPKLMMANNKLQAVLLDDAFQHLAILPGLNILLTEHDYLFTRDFLLPVGRLREWKSGYKRADIIVVSKCPPQITQEEKEKITAEIAPQSFQKIFYSYYKYSNPYFLFNGKQRINLDQDTDVLLICAIAKTDYLTDYLEAKVGFLKSLEYEDHRYFSDFDMNNLLRHYNAMEGQKKIILTTEKDAMRLELHRKFLIDNKLPIFVLPIQVAFHFDEGQQFDAEIKQFLLDFKV